MPYRPPPPVITIVAAVAENGVIGKSGAPLGLPWDLPDELAFFRRLTLGGMVIMGRRTLEEIRRPMPGCRNVVLSSSPDFRPAGATVVSDLAAALALGRDEPEVFILGGTEVFRQAFAVAHRMHLTQVHAVVEGDAWFPPWDRAAWVLESAEEHPADARHAHRFTFQVFARARPG